MTTKQHLQRLRRDQYNESEASTPGGLVPSAEDRAFDLGYRKGWNDHARGEIAIYSQGDVEAGLRELCEAAP